MRTSDSEAGVNEEKSGCVVREQGECGDDVVGLRLFLNILSVKKEAKRSARELPGVEEGNGEEDFRCNI